MKPFRFYFRFSCMGLFAQTVLLSLGTSGALAAEGVKALERSEPEAQGISSAAIVEFLEAADQQVKSMHSFMLVRHGKVVAEAWWDPESPNKPHVMWSLSKSFTSTAVGLAVGEGKVRLDDPVIKFFPEQAPEEPSDFVKAMTVRDLLTMTAGHKEEAKVRSSDHWVKTFLAQPVPHRPGTHFLYNTPATYMLSAIVQKVTGENVAEYLKPRLFSPLGIQDPQWASSPEGITLGGYGLIIKTEDIAKFGQLYLQKGQWEGKQIVPAEWVEAATSRQVPNDGGRPNADSSDWAQGYGYQFWRCRHGAFRGDGKDGQFCVVMPEQDAVIAITANTSNMQLQLDLIWKHLLPAMGAKPLPAAPEAVAKLRERSTSLKVAGKSPAATPAR